MNSSNSLDFSELEECLKNLNDLQKSIQDDLEKKNRIKEKVKKKARRQLDSDSKGQTVQNSENRQHDLTDSSVQREQQLQQQPQQLQQPQQPQETPQAPSNDATGANKRVQMSASVMCTDLDELLSRLTTGDKNVMMARRDSSVTMRSKPISSGHHTRSGRSVNCSIRAVSSVSVRSLKTEESVGNFSTLKQRANSEYGSVSGSCLSLPRIVLNDTSDSFTAIYKTSSQTNLTRADAEYKMPVTVHQYDKSSRTILIDETTTAGTICQLMTARNYTIPTIGLSLVEKIPHLRIERCFEDDETPLSCLLSYKDIERPSLLFFEDRKDKYGLFLEPEKWLGSSFQDVSSSSIAGIFAGTVPQLPTYRAYLFYKAMQRKSWRRRLCILRNSGLYAYRKSRDTDSTNLQLIISLHPSLHLYTTTGGWSNAKSPTPYGFCLKTYGEQNPKFITYFCALTECGLRYWSSLFRIAIKGKTLIKNYENQRQVVKETVDFLQENDLNELIPPLGKSIGCVSGRTDISTDL